MSSDTKDPDFTISFIFFPKAVSFFISDLSKSPVDNWNKLNFTINFD